MALLAVAVASVGVFVASGQSIHRQQRDTQNDAAARATATIVSEVAGAEGSLVDTAAFIASSQQVTRSEFARYTKGPLSRPAIRSIGFVSRVPASRRAQVEKAIGAPISLLRPGGKVAPAPRRREYFPVTMVATESGAPGRLGVDASMDPLRGAAMMAAVRTRQPAATPPLRTLNGGWLPLLYVPVYRPSGRLQGLVGAGLDSHALVQAATASFPGSAAVRVLDGKRVVFEMPADYTSANRSSVPVAGRQWTVEVVAPAAVGPAQLLRWIVALCGLALLAVLLTLFRRATREAEHAEQLVQARTHELHERTRQLDDALRDAQTARAALSERNESLLELDRFKDRMLALISHDLRSPLTSIRGYVELLLDDETGPLHEGQRRFLSIVKRNADRLDSQIGDLLLAANVAEGRLHLERSAVDVVRLVMEAAEAAGPQASAKSIDLEAACRPMRPVDADGPRLAQVLDNLLSNAIKYTPEGGRVDVRAWRDGDSVTLCVSDTGPGMTAEEQISIFEPFFRTEDARESGIRGTGLGLVIVKAVVEAHGGTVTVRSEPGRGSSFLVAIPASVPAPWMPAERLTTLRA